MPERIVQNEIQCKNCNDIIYSAHRHDYKECSCGAVAVDGGLDYLRRTGDFTNIVERSICLDSKVVDDITTAVKWAVDTNRNDFGIALAVVRALREHGLLKED